MTVRGVRQAVAVGTALVAVVLQSKPAQPAPRRLPRSCPSTGDVVAYESPRLAALAKALDAGQRDALAQFWKEIQGKAPLVERIREDPRFCWVTYIWHGSAETRSVGLLGTKPEADRTKWFMSRFRDTDLWYKTERIPKDARFGYMLNENETGFRSDPLNLRTWAGRSVVELPDAPEEPWIRQYSEVPRGRVSQTTIKSEILGEERSLSIYLPPGYNLQWEPYGLLVVFDGESYGPNRAVPTPIILDNLIYRLRIPPLVAVLVNSQQTRDRDLLCSEAFENFLAKELIPRIRREYHVTNDPTRVIVAGSSYGGLSAACTAFRHPDVFGNVLAQSGSFNYAPKNPGNPDDDYAVETGWLIKQFVLASRLPLRFYLQAGWLEGGPFGNILSSNRRLRDVLEAKGYPVTYDEYTGGHDYLSWRRSLGEGLIALVGSQRLW